AEARVEHGPPASAPYQRPRQSPFVRLGKRLRDPVNAWFAHQSLIDTGPMVNPADLAGLEALQRDWRGIRDELQSLLAGGEDIPSFGRISPDHRRIASGPQWKSFFFYGYGYRARENCAKCPHTSALLEQVPGLVVAFFSILDGDAQIPPHRGLTKAWINCHLGLVVPTAAAGSACEIEVDGRISRWREGEWMVFDETYRHRVWNTTGSRRVVLMLQVERPMRWPGRIAAAALRWIISRTSFVKDVRRALDR
ncbi:MAG: aspartyl/asparaginyl beta-hydroxylase domain-containing protein, partial [Erythrobacter sp.]|nr:aspartyl/asparaginyl beta-hydroxylase domain-containing protein [Erythrobacter sp.]